MTKIVQLVAGRAIQPNLVNEYFHTVKGVDSPVDAALFKQKAELYGLNWLGLYCMALIETGWFTSTIFKTKRNMFGLGAVDSDPIGGAAIFFNFEEAVEAGAQHLAVYAGAKSVQKKPASEFILERTAKLRDWDFFGIVNQFSDLGGKNEEGKVKWASNPEHGAQIEKMIAQITKYCETVYQPAPKEPEPVIPEPIAPEPPAEASEWKQLVALALKVGWPILTKFFPWLGWATVAVYAIIEFLLK